MLMEISSAECLVSCLGVHTTRITRQRIIKQKQKDELIVELTKKEEASGGLRAA